MTAIPCLRSKVPLKPKKVTPSVYTQEMLQSTEERLAKLKEMHQPRILEHLDISNTTHHKLSVVGMNQTLFQPHPSELVFQNFTPGQTYTLPLRLYNKDKVSRKVKLERQDSDFFHVAGPEDAGSRVAPGLAASFTVSFTPQENKDYHHRLVCVTERERFEVPILAIGPRGILDFRDELHLPICTVKASTERTHLVRNIGNAVAKFNLDTKSPFSVKPPCGTLDVGESMQVTVTFNPMTTGDHSQDLHLHYHTGEDVHICLYGACEELDIHLECESVLVNPTYISLANVCKVSLTYKSEIPLKYCWTTWPSLQEETLSFLRESSSLQQKEEEEKKRWLVQCESDPTAIYRIPQLSKALQERRSQLVEDQRLVLSHSCLTLEPAEGEIWPKTPAQFNIIFKPDEAKLYQQTIYCHVTGREARLPLTIKAQGLGPNLQLTYNQMDMKNVDIGGKDCYEVEMYNKGVIDAPFRMSNPDTTFGRCFSFSPEEGVVSSGAWQIVQVTFQSCILGTFSEDLLLTVTGQPQPLTVTFRGCVVVPALDFNVSEINFGDVAFGFPQTLAFTLYNTSFVPLNFSLRVLGDGRGSPSVTSLKQAVEVSRINWECGADRGLRAQPVEFTVMPATGSMRSLSDVTIKVTLCSNTVKTYRLALVVDVEGVGEEIGTLPIYARCCVPDIVVETPVLDFERCFLDHPYEQLVRLTNSSPLLACYGMLDQEHEENPSLLLGSDTPRGLILPRTSEELPVVLLAKAVGRQQHTLRIAVFGSSQPPLEVVLFCVGQGPKVHVETPKLDFGRIPVLTDITRVLHLSNESPIPAHFTARMWDRGSFGRVEPSEGEVPPESQLELRVVAHLKDTQDFKATLEISIRDSQTHTVHLSATGTGTTIVSDKTFAPALDLGAYFSHESCQYHFKLTNHGKRVQRMYWRIDSFLPSAKTQKGVNPSDRTVLPPISAPRKKDILGRGSSLPSSREKPVFSLTPLRAELFPGHSVDMVLTGSSDSSKLVREHLVCHGIVGNQGTKELIMSVDLTCRFVAPMLSISSKQLKFYIEKVPGQSLTPLFEKLIFENVSSLPLHMELSLVEPFSLCEASGAHIRATTKSMVLGNGRKAELWVCFDPSSCRDRVSQVMKEVLELHYRGHPQRDIVELHAEVQFSNLRFSSTTVDFGCVLNCTGSRREISMTNSSPLPVSYRWAFLEDHKHCAIRDTEMVEKEKEQSNPENPTGEGRSSSRTRARASSIPLSHRPAADEESCKQRPVGVEEVFDILPIYGHLQPGEQQQVVFSFYGHENVSREVVARCHVEDGPTYEVKLRGEASEISYSLDSTHIDFGLQLFDHKGEADVTLRNTGRMGFTFNIIYHKREDGEAGEEAGQKKALVEEQTENGQEVRPGQPMVTPTQGYVDAGVEQCLRVLYLPGVPELFDKRLELQVAFLPPQDIRLTGEGVFPRITLNLPRNLSDECYRDVVQQAGAAVEADRVKEELLTAGGGAPTEANCTPTYEQLLHMEIERALVKQNALAVTGSLQERRDSQGSSRKWHKLSQFPLPEYVLDFGYVILGQVLSHTVNVTNTGAVAVSFQLNEKPLAGSGFSTELKRVKNLPCGETQTLEVKFDPQGSNLKMGDTQVVMSIQVTRGPVVQVRLSAMVTVPAITVSTDTLQFDTMQCNMCQMKTIQLFNHESMPCCWTIAEEWTPLKKRKKVSQEHQPPQEVFKAIPSSGLLSPGERVNVQIKFSPADGLAYNRQLAVHVAESSKQVFIRVQGQGEEPRLEFSQSKLELGPCLSLNTEVEAEVTVRNPCSFPIEFYSLEFDTQYLEEEKILHLMQGYDENNMLLLPPRAPGESLTSELLDYYKEYCSQLKDDEPNEDEKEAEMDDTHRNKKTLRQNDAHTAESKLEETQTVTVKPAELLVSEMTKEGCIGRLGQLEMTPVSRAIARHMCVDLSPEGLAARNRRGIAIVVYGAPLIGRGSTVAALARHYGGASLSVDAVVTAMLLNGTSPVSLTARRLYDQAAEEYAEKKAEEAAHLLASVPDPQSAPASLDTAENSEDSCSQKESNAPQETENTHFALCLGGDVTTLCNLLPEQLLVDVLAERFQLSDCHRGIVMDGLESVYTQSAANTLQAVLKALNNRKHIYTVNLSDSYTALQARERAQRETEEALQKEISDRKEQWLQELDEEEYDALPEEDKEQITRHHIENRRQQKVRELEHILKEEEEQRQQEEMKRLREEELKKKSKKGGKKDVKETSRKKSLLEGKQSTDGLNGNTMSPSNNSKESLVDAKEQHHLNEVHQSKEADDLQKQTEETKALNTESPQPADKVDREKSADTAEMKRLKEEKELKKNKKSTLMDVPLMSKETLVDAKEQPQLNGGASKLPQSKEADPSPKKTEEAKRLQAESPKPVDKPKGDTSVEDELQSQFSVYEKIQEQVEHILHHWDRAQSLLLLPLPTEEAPLSSEDTAAEKHTPVGRKNKKAHSKIMSPILSQIGAPAEADKVSPQEIIPHIVLNVTGKDSPSATELLKGSTLPQLVQVLDDLGLGPSGPPIPPPATFSVVPFPKSREQSMSKVTCSRFTFLVPSGQEEQDEEKKDSEEDLHASVVKEEATHSKGRSKGSTKEGALTKDKKGQKSKRQTSAKTKTKVPVISRTSARDSLDCSEQDLHQGNLELKRSQSLTHFRWVVPANSEVVLKIWFYSESPETFEQTFNFELLGTQRLYQLVCKGICTYPSICKDHTTLFAFSKKVSQMEKGLEKTYAIKPGCFEFGPLLCGKTRDRYKESRYPENTERLVIQNTSGLEAEVQFSFQHDTQAATYLLHPPTMTLKPDQKQELTVWAYPTNIGQMKDSIICQIKENPEPVIINISCWGVRPELELESKHLHCNRTMLHRRNSCSVTLHNKTALPVSWKLQGVDELGDEFSLPQDQGVISANSSFLLSLHFRAKKPLHIKKILRLEVSDVEKILGVMQTENIQVTAEAYDVALEIIPADGCLDFGTIKVFEEGKMSLRLKNQGKYETAYKLTLQQTDPPQPNLESIFTLSPWSGTLMPHEKPTTVQILCKANKEISMIERPILLCQLIEPNIGNGEVVATLTINISVKSVFSRYKITPACDINFGPLVYGYKKSESFTIENNGTFETRYSVCHLITDATSPGKQGGPGKKSQSERATGATSKVRRESIQRDLSITQNRLTIGVFSVSPCNGSLNPGSQQVVTVECVSDQLGSWNQDLLIDISDRDPLDHPDGIPYKLLAEVCKPGISLDMASIFEEHHLCNNSSQLSSEQFCNAEGIYVQDENKFVFNKALVGRTAKARFKLTNNSKVPCALNLAIKYVGAKLSRGADVFDLSATTLSIPEQSHVFAVVTFTPQAMQLYSAVFEATMDVTSRMTPTFKSKVLEFDLMGEGNMPSVCVVRPVLRTSRGNPRLQFTRVSAGRPHTRPLVLLNDGNVPAQVQIDMLDKHGVFTLKAAPGNTCSAIYSSQIEGTTKSEHQLVHRVTLRLNVREQAEFEVGFCSDKPLIVKAKMSLHVEDNKYSNTTIQITGEAYQEIISLDNISRSSQEIEEDDEGAIMHFGDCHVDSPYQESFTMSNHSSSQAVRFEWPPAGSHICFSPQVGHLHAGCSKEVVVTFCSNQPVTLTRQPMRCKVSQVEFQQPLEQVADWDDRQRTVQWLSSSRPASASTQQTGKNKVKKTDPEPCCSIVEGSQLELELRISAVCDYVKFSCNADTIHFKDARVYQTRLHQDLPGTEPACSSDAGKKTVDPPALCLKKKA